MKLRLFVVLCAGPRAWPGAVWTAIGPRCGARIHDRTGMPPPPVVAETEAEFPGYYLATWKISR
jgi:hypothetical protein